MKLTVQDLAMYIGCKAELRKGSVMIIDIITPSTLAMYSDNSVKPILRPLSDMTEEEMKQAFDSGHPDDLKYVIIKNTWSPERLKYLISKHFDVFGWIEKGLAIDKTVLTKNQEVK